MTGKVVLGVDRLDYAKGVLEKLAGLESFFSEHPQWRQRLHYVQIGQIGPTSQEQFAAYAQAVADKVVEINAKFGTAEWQPIVFIGKHLQSSQLAAWYQLADVLAVSPIRDGVNLIAKEFVASRLDEQGVLILSQRAGLASELAEGAIVIDPAASDRFTDGLLVALTMPESDSRQRMRLMRQTIGTNRLHDWAVNFLREAIGTLANYR